MFLSEKYLHVSCVINKSVAPKKTKLTGKYLHYIKHENVYPEDGNGNRHGKNKRESKER